MRIALIAPFVAAAAMVSAMPTSEDTLTERADAKYNCGGEACTHGAKSYCGSVLYGKRYLVQPTCYADKVACCNGMKRFSAEFGCGQLGSHPGPCKPEDYYYPGGSRSRSPYDPAGPPRK